MSERFAWIYDKAKDKKVWVADMWARKRVLTLQNQVATLQSQVSTLQTNYTALEARVAALEGNTP